MRTKLLIILTLTFFALFSSCKKAPLTVGKTVIESRRLPDFTEVYLNDDISMSLVRSDTCYIVIKTGENIIDNITTDVKNGILTINNTTTLSWIRPYDYELSVTLYYKDISNFIFSSSRNLTTQNQYNDPDNSNNYRFEISGGSGDVDLFLNDCKNFIVLYHSGTSRLNLHGSNHYIQIDKHSYGILDASQLQSKRVDIHNRSVADCYIWATEVINAKISRHGNIYYKGTPSEINCTYGEYAEGKLIPFN